jgi:integrase/recombinase XerD
MFEKMFSFPAVVRRHRGAPLAAERLEYLKYLNDRGVALGTVLRQARYCLCVAHEIQRWPRDHFFNAIAASWAARRVAQGRAAAPRWPQEQFHSVACSFLSRLGRLAHDPDPPSGPYDALLEDFLEVECEGRGLALATRNKQRWHIRQFLSYLNQQSHSLESLTPGHVDAYLVNLGQKWNRVSLSTTASVLRAWLRHCEIRGKTQSGLADSILVPRIYRHEGLPLGPTWEHVKDIIPGSSGEKPPQLRDRAILLLLAVYGLRSGEVRRLRIDDIDCKRDCLTVVRSKSGRRELFPLEPHTGNAIALYLRTARPKCDSRSVFYNLKRPFPTPSRRELFTIL